VISYCINSVSANLVLHRTVERIHVGKKYGDIPRGIFVIRGENVVLLGEVVSCIYCVLKYDSSTGDTNYVMKLMCCFTYRTGQKN